jgi:phosphate starvation-inducible PhoH-like protein
MLKESEVEKIVITRPTVTVEENLGYLPGSLEDKVYPFLIPIYDYFLEHYTKENLMTMIHNGKLEVSPLAYMRGRTFKNTVIIADEMQNTTPNQMKMILTRIGENSKLIITGDLEQNDLSTYNGLQNIVDLIEKKYEDNYHGMLKDGFGYIHLDDSCIHRHPIIEKIINLYK